MSAIITTNVIAIIRLLMEMDCRGRNKGNSESPPKNTCEGCSTFSSETQRAGMRRAAAALVWGPSVFLFLFFSVLLVWENQNIFCFSGGNMRLYLRLLAVLVSKLQSPCYGNRETKDFGAFHFVLDLPKEHCICRKNHAHAHTSSHAHTRARTHACTRNHNDNLWGWKSWNNLGWYLAQTSVQRRLQTHPRQVSHSVPETDPLSQPTSVPTDPQLHPLIRLRSNIP